MGQFQGTGIEGPHDAQGFPDHDVPASLPYDLGLETVYHPGILQPFDAFGQGAIEDTLEGPLIIVGQDGLGLSFDGVEEVPTLFVKRLFLVRGTSPRHGRGGGGLPSGDWSVDIQVTRTNAVRACIAVGNHSRHMDDST